MYLKNYEPDHSKSEISEAFGISSEELCIVREKIIFASVANLYQIRDLYGEDEDDIKKAPANLRSVTGAMKRAFSMMDNKKEYEASILYILSFSQMARASFAIYMEKKMKEQKNKNGKAKEEDVAEALLTMLKKLKKDLESKVETPSEDVELFKDGEGVYNEETMMKRVEFVKKSCYNFEYYLNMLNSDWGIPMPPVDDIIGSALNGTDEDSGF